MRNTFEKEVCTRSIFSCSTLATANYHTHHPVHSLILNLRPSAAMLVTLLILTGFCANAAHGSPAQTGRNISTIRTQQCREGCFEKFATKETLCQQSAECLTCWDECSKPPPPKINKSIRETWSLHTVSMLQQDSLVLVDVAWAPLSTPNQCLVTWEVSGGGLMGNLLTESFNVQLSLWPDTKYRVQVTCKNKLNGIMSRSLPLTIDTAEAISTHEHSQPPTPKQTSTTLPPVGDNIPRGSILEDLAIKSDAPFSAEQEDISAEPALDASGSAGSSLPYDDQSAETINQHTNFIFNWHKKNSDISAIEPLAKPDLNLLNITSLSQLQKPLIFGVVAGTLLLAFILLLYICMTRQQRLSSDKIALITDDMSSVAISFPPTTPVGIPATSTSYGGTAEEVCQHAAICSRNALKV